MLNFKGVLAAGPISRTPLDLCRNIYLARRLLTWACVGLVAGTPLLLKKNKLPIKYLQSINAAEKECLLIKGDVADPGYKVTYIHHSPAAMSKGWLTSFETRPLGVHSRL